MAPTPPTGLSITFPSPTTAILTWKASVVSKGTIVLYRVLYAKAGARFWSLGPLTQSLSVSFAGLSSKTLYDFIVEASDVMGTSVSAILQVTTPSAGTPPSVAQNVTISNVSASGLTVSWQPPSSGDAPLSYQLQQLSPGATNYVNVGLATNQTSVAVTGLSAFSTYSYRVVTSNATGNSTTSPVSVTTSALLPSAPSAPVVNGTPGQTTVSLSWIAPLSGSQPITYQIFEATPSGNGNFVAGQTTQSLSITVTGLQPATSYDFEIVASNAAGNGPPSPILSNVVTAGVPVAPAAPTNLTAGTPTSTTLPFSWSPSPSGTPPVSYVLQYRPTPASIVAPTAPTAVTSGTPGTNSIPLSWTAPTTGTLPISYNILQSPHGANTFAVVGNSTVATFTVTGLQPSTQYDFQVQATNAAGTSPSSATLTAQTAAIATIPGVPASITAGSPTISSITVSWTQPTTGGIVGGYTVSFKLATAGSYTTFLNVPVCTPGAGSIVQNGTWTITPAGVIQVNGAASVGAAGFNAVQLTFINGLFWQETNTGSWYSEAANTGSWVGPIATPPWSLPVTGLTANTTYNFEVNAFNGIGAGPRTAAATATTTIILTDGINMTQAQVNGIMSAINTIQVAEVPPGECFSGTCFPQNALIGDILITTGNGVQLNGPVGSLTDKDGNLWTLNAGTVFINTDGGTTGPDWWYGGYSLNGTLVSGGFLIAMRLDNNGHVWVEEAKQGGWRDVTLENENGVLHNNTTWVWINDPGPGPNN